MESAQLEVFVRPFPTSPQGRKPISTSGGTRPNWSRGGRELLYQEGDRIMSVSYTPKGNSFEAAPPRVRVQKLGANEEDWDLAPDGRIAASVPLPAQEAATPRAPEHHVVFIENFFDGEGLDRSRRRRRAQRNLNRLSSLPAEAIVYL